MKKLYKSASYDKSPDGFAVILDKKPALTPLEKPLRVPSPKLAEAIAFEWQAQKEIIRKETMPLTHIACIAIDLVGEKRSAVCEEVLVYAETDLVCYRAGNIPVLHEEQNAKLSAILAWAEHRFLVELAVTDSLMPVAQPAANNIKLRTVLSEYDDYKLAVIAAITKPLGSLILALALAERHLSADAAFECAFLEEAYETQQWGEDDEKQARMHKIREEISAAERFLSLL